MALHEVDEPIGMKVAAMRRWKSLLPQAFIGSMNTDAIECRRDPEENAPAAGEVDHEQSPRMQAVTTSRQHVPRIVDMLEHVVEHDHIVARGRRESIREKAHYDRVTSLRSSAPDPPVRLDTLHGIAPLRSGIEKPSMRATDVEQHGPVRAQRCQPVKYDVEVLLPQGGERRLAALLVDPSLGGRLLDRRVER
ncbi:MAG TPA: hypothetical protein VLQ46_14395 [Casimicrobiaceae bacterium]|nr:hypothetical protein [Casimicrobiaceae bacterium]